MESNVKDCPVRKDLTKGAVIILIFLIYQFVRTR
jgi:hypothetical protein